METTALTTTKGVDLVTIPDASATRPQGELLKFVEQKLTESGAACAELDEAIGHARKLKWKLSSLQGALHREQAMYRYYEKVVAALEAGYVVMPPIDGELFAARVDENALLPADAKSPHSWDKGRLLSDASSNAPPLGEGEYVGPRAKWRCYYSDNDKGEQIRTEYATEFDPSIPFPLIVAKPALMDATQRAMALRAFDDIFVSPGTRRRKGDPIIYGRIQRPGRGPLCFLIGWLVRSEDI